MRITLLTVGSRGDVQPFVAFGLGLQAAGHEVCLATHPRYATLVQDRGLTFAPLAEGHVSRGAETDEGRRWIQRGNRRLPAVAGFLRDARSVADERLADAAAAGEGADAIVASNLAMLLGWQVADRVGVPLVRAYIEPPAWLMTRRPARRAAPVIRQAAWMAARPWINGVRRRALDAPPVGLREPFAVLDREGALVLYAFSPAVLPVPGAGDGSSVTGYWFLDEDADPAPPPGLQAFLDAGPPPVSVGFGTMIDTDPGATVALVADALRQAGQRGVLIRGAHTGDHTPLPPHLFAVGSISHAWLFPRCAAAVHYAPAGTTAAALRAGIPSVAVPQMTDQFLWARRLHELGVAPEPVARRQLTAARLAEAVRAAAEDDGMRRRATALGERIRAEDGVATAVDAFTHHVNVRPPIPVT